MQAAGGLSDSILSAQLAALAKRGLGSESLCPGQKIQLVRAGFFICADRHNIICVAHATSFDRQVNVVAARGTNERG